MFRTLDVVMIAVMTAAATVTYSIKHQAENKLSAPCPNKFYVCVPMGLESEAVKWCEAVDPRYGVMVFVGWKFLSENPVSSSIFTLRVAQDLHSEYKSMRDKIAMRLCSAAACQKMREARNSIKSGGV